MGLETAGYLLRLKKRKEKGEIKKMTREDFIKTHLSGQEPRCGMGELITTASYDAMYNGPHREMIQRHYEYAFELALYEHRRRGVRRV